MGLDQETGYNTRSNIKFHYDCFFVISNIIKFDPHTMIKHHQKENYAPLRDVDIHKHLKTRNSKSNLAFIVVINFYVGFWIMNTYGVR